MRNINNAQHTTHNIANKGFRGMRGVVARFNSSCTVIGKKPAIPYWPYFRIRQIVSFDIFNSDKQLNLRYIQKNIFELELYVSDDEGDSRQFVYLLKEEDIKIVPEGLINLMKEVQKTDKEETYYIGGLN